MSRDVNAVFQPVAGTGAALGTTGGHSVLADRPAGVAGGTGLGFSGAELLAMAIGGCFWNDLHHVAAAAAVRLMVDRVETAVTLAGSPLRVVRAHVHAFLSGASEDELQAVFDEACETSTIANSIGPAIPVAFERHPGAA